MVAAQAVVGVMVVTTSLGKDAVPAAVARADAIAVVPSCASTSAATPRFCNGVAATVPCACSSVEVMASAGDGGVIKELRGPSRLQA